MTPQQILARLKALATALSPSQLVTLALAFVAVVAIVGGSGWWLSRPSYVLLFADMDPASASEVVTKLDAQKVDYRLDAGGRNIRVPEAQVDKLRIELSSEGLPTSGRIGFEIFDRTAFGATEFLEHVNYRRALEGEIARTIATLSEVSGARVHIAMAKDSLFGAREQPAKASVVLKLRSNRPLANGTIQGIANLVAASVEGLRPESVVILDSFGRPLARPPAADDGEPLGSAEIERQQRIERDFATRVVALLEPVVGSDRVRATVAVRLSPDSEERTEETWDPASTVIRSKQQTNDLTPLPNGGGVSGARANLPPSAPPASSNAATAQAAAPSAGSAPSPSVPPNMASRSTETVNNEISRTTKHVVRPRGDVARVSVAVVVDDELVATRNTSGKVEHKTKPRTPAELQKLQGLVAAAVGIDQTRGDQLTVENIAFDMPVVEDPPPPGLVERYGDSLTEVGRIGTVVGVVLLLVFFVLRPLVVGAGVRALPAGAAPAAQLPGGGATPRTVRELEGEIEAQLDAAAQARTLENLRVPVLTKKAGAMIQNEPENAARLLRGWLTEEER